MDVAAKLAELNIELPQPVAPIASYVPAVRTGSLLIISGQLPMADGNLLATGKVPSHVKIDAAAKAAGQCAINALAIVADHLDGDWSKLKRIVRLGVFVQSADSFSDQSIVANGASDLMVSLFGDAGKHARAAVGVNALPLNAAVEVEMTVELAG